jgi:predicted Rossmann fold nucleotide-binding protein DprA/Smf involved in DNA uptake
MPDVLDKIRSDLEKRVRELEPLIQEHKHLSEALVALKGVGTRAERAVKGVARSPRPTKTNTATRGRGRPRGTGGRAQEALKLVHKHPGITIGEMAKRMKIQANYLYRLLPQLEKDGKVKKRDKGYHSPEG